MRAHMRAEETILLPIFVERTGMDELARGLVNEHTHIREHFDTIACCIADDDCTHALAELEALDRLLFLHQQREETVLYPKLEILLSDLQEQDLVHRLGEAEGAHDGLI